ncbi:MAG: CvpA family protein [Terriglobia bacterium]
MGVWNWVDWIFAVVILLSVIFAARKGFVRELISLAAVVVGIVVAALEFRRAAGWFEDLTSSHAVALAAGFLAIFVTVLIAGAIVSALARFLIRSAGVEWFDRFLGGIFGLIRGIIVDSILLMVLVAFAIKPAAVGRSQLAPYISTGARALVVLMPRDLKSSFRAGFQRFRQAVMEGGKTSPTANKSSL